MGADAASSTAAPPASARRSFFQFESPHPESLAAHAQIIRADAIQLRQTVAEGSYAGSELTQFWTIVERSSRVLEVSPRHLSERAGLGPNFFRDVVRQRRYPKLTNMLRALTAIVEEADEILADSNIENLRHGGGIWVTNPIHGTSQVEELQRVLIDLIAALKSSNSLSDVPELDRYWRENLITLLETTIVVLKAPMLEDSLIRRTAGLLKKAGLKVASDGSAGFFGALAGGAAAELLKLLVK